MGRIKVDPEIREPTKLIKNRLYAALMKWLSVKKIKKSVRRGSERARTKKIPDGLSFESRPVFSCCRRDLTLCDSVVRTNLCAASAADACVGIDMIDIALGDCVYRANRHAGAACYTVVANYVCHNSCVLSYYCLLSELFYAKLEFQNHLSNISSCLFLNLYSV